MNEEVSAAVTNAIGQWQSGQQQPAVEILRPLADLGEPVPLALICWFLHQMPEPFWRQGVEYAREALAKGMPWVHGYFVGNMQQDPSMAPEVGSFYATAYRAGWPIDPIGTAVGMFQQGQQPAGLSVLATVEAPWPYPGAWESRLQEAERHFKELKAAAGQVSQRRDEVVRSIDSSKTAIDGHETTVRSRTQSLVKLIEQLTNAQAQQFFEGEADTYAKEAKSLWTLGLRVLSAAAFIAVLPILLYYLGKVFSFEVFEGQNIVAAHFAPAIALGAVAGVLLARSRGRDRARQRAKDLSVALSTMFVYSEQIEEGPERQTFLRDMGRVVIESFIRQDSGTAIDEGGSNLLNALLRAR